MTVSTVSIIIIACLIAGYEEHVCNNKWRTVLETNENGKPEGSKSQLIKYVLSGADLRMRVHGLDFNGDVTMDANTAYITPAGDEICSQSILHVGKYSWNEFEADAFWRFLLICTTGHVNKAPWYVGEHTKPEADSTTRHRITWYIRPVGCDSYKSLAKPIFCTDKDCGPVTNLFDAISSGSDLRVVSEEYGYATRLDHAIFSKRKNIVGAESVWSISQQSIEKHAEFAGDAFWWFTLWSSAGTVHMARWKVGEHVSLGQSKAQFQMNWYTDACWQLAYSHDGNGKAKDGSLEFLKAGILSGHRVRVVIGPYVIEADNLLIRDQHVSAQLLGHVSKKDVDTFHNESYWFWQHVATTGEVETIRPMIGSNENKGSSGGRHSIKWFIDTRHWKRSFVFNVDPPTKASKTELLESIIDGSLVRIVIKENENNIMAIRADNLGLSTNKSDVMAQSIRNIGHFYPAGSVREFHSVPYWEFTSVATTGDLMKTKWSTGTYEFRGDESIKVDMEWFTD